MLENDNRRLLRARDTMDRDFARPLHIGHLAYRGIGWSLTSTTAA